MLETKSMFGKGLGTGPDKWRALGEPKLRQGTEELVALKCVKSRLHRYSESTKNKKGVRKIKTLPENGTHWNQKKRKRKGEAERVGGSGNIERALALH